MLAIAWFILLALLAGLRAYGIRRASSIGLAVGALSIPAVIYLDYIQLAILKLSIFQLCSDCEIAHAIGLILFGLFIVMYRADSKTKVAGT